MLVICKGALLVATVFFLHVTTCTAQVLESGRESGQRVLINTGHVLDLAVAGKGYLELVSTDGDKLFVKSARFELVDQMLAVSRDGVAYQLNRIIVIDALADGLFVNPDGRVRQLTLEDSSITDVGNFHVVRLAPDLDTDESQVIARQTETKTIVQGLPSRDGNGVILQGWIDEDWLAQFRDKE